MHIITLDKGQRSRLRKAVGERVYQLTADRQAQGQLFKAIHSAIKEHYNISSYQHIPAHKILGALDFIANWKG